MDIVLWKILIEIVEVDTEVPLVVELLDQNYICQLVGILYFLDGVGFE